MIVSAIHRAILSRIKADTGVGGLYASSAWNIISGAYSIFGTPAAIVYPYLMFTTRMEQDHSLTSDDFRVTATFTCFDQVLDYTSTTAFSGRVSAVMDRLHGDAVLQAGRVPTYGFHRHLLVLPTNGYTAQATNCFVTTQDVTMTDEHSLAATMIMTFRVSALASNP
jgi:hypothetical protein